MSIHDAVQALGEAIEEWARLDTQCRKIPTHDVQKARDDANQKIGQTLYEARQIALRIYGGREIYGGQ